MNQAYIGVRIRLEMHGLDRSVIVCCRWTGAPSGGLVQTSLLIISFCAQEELQRYHQHLCDVWEQCSIDVFHSLGIFPHISVVQLYQHIL